MSNHFNFVAAALLGACAVACAQQTVPGPPAAADMPVSPAAPDTAPAAAAPPTPDAASRTDLGIAQQPPATGDTRSMSGPPASQADPTMARQPPADARAAERVTPPAVPPTGSSRQDDCRGRADLCKQDSAR